MKYVSFQEQSEFHNNPSRFRGAFAGKRGGKTESGAIEAIIHAENMPTYDHSEIDPHIGFIAAPTTDMLRRLSIHKLLAYGKNFVTDYNKTHNEITWHNGSLIYGISAEKPQRMEGIKAYWGWIDEIFQIKEQFFLEAIARLSDTEGRLWVTGSLGTQYTNPKNHWVYKYFKHNPNDDTWSIEWPTAANPHFPKNELTRLKNTLDPRTFRQMFTIDWTVPGTALVYDDFETSNIDESLSYNKDLPLYVCIDWGWTHPMACLFIQYDRMKDTVYVVDEIIQSKLKLEQLWDKIKAKKYKITDWVCDIAGDQEREQSGISNMKYFRETHSIHFKASRAKIIPSISVVRSYIKTGSGQRKLIVSGRNCPKTIDCMLNYSYPEKNGEITDEKPLKVDDDAADALRYFFVNIINKMKQGPQYKELDRWKLMKF